MSKKNAPSETNDLPDDSVASDARPETGEPAWLADPDYTGPLTCDQAARRLKRHGHHVTKPEAEPVTK